MPHTDLDDFDRIAAQAAALREAIGRVVVGQQHVITPLLAALLCQGHVLIIGVPGLAKTLLVRTLAAATGLTFKRVQFTPDMMPGDILGTELIQEDPATGTRALRFAPGPIFTQLLLADEVNRTPPKTQAALLEAMAERQVTIAGRPLALEAPFLVIATQNPIEQEGTYPLPEAQLDRFALSLEMDYPDRDDERRIVAEAPRIAHEHVEPVLDAATLLRAAALIEQMPLSEHIVDRAVALVRATRPHDPGAPPLVRKYVAWGAGPRAGQHLMQVARALAAMDGEPTPTETHLRAALLPVLRHRLVINYAGVGDDITPAALLAAVQDTVL